MVFLVHMSCKEEAINAYNALNGKSIMRGAALIGGTFCQHVNPEMCPVKRFLWDCITV